MRIGMILDKPFPPDPRVENEAITLIQNGFKVYLFCLKYDNAKAEETINGIQVKRFPSNTLQYKLSALAYTFPFYTNIMSGKIAKFLHLYNIETIHVHDIRIAGAVFKANEKMNLPVVLDLHDNFPEVMKLYPHLQKFPGKQLISPKKWQEKEEEFIHKATKVITVSPEFEKEVINRTKIEKSKMVLVPNSVRESFYKEAKFEQKILEKYKNNFVLLYLGDTGLRRGLQTAIAAVKKLKSEIKNIKLVIVGKNTTDPILREQINTLQLENFVDLEGWQEVDLFPSYIQASGICISPLHRNKQHDVAYANKIFQYMSFAKPVLVSDATAQKKLVLENNCGLVHEAKNVDDFAQKVLSLYKDDTQRNKLGENGKNFIKTKFNWEKTSINLIHLYKELAQKNRKN